MALDGLISDAYQRGCGISRTSALKSARYHELVASATRMLNTSQSETAEMMYLGELLADRAFRNLPPALRKLAEQWSKTSPDEQQATLNTLMTQLTTPQWLLIHKQKHGGNNALRAVLPAERGSWNRGRVQPNCLGLTQMLIGFARATGAEHMMVDIVTPSDFFLEQVVEQQCRTMMELLAPYCDAPYIARLNTNLETHRLASLTMLASMEKDQQAHHALLIKVGSAWILVDPYLQHMYTIDALSRGGIDPYRAVAKHPGKRWLCYGGNAIHFDLAYVTETLQEVLKLYARRSESIRSFDLMDVATKASITLSWIGESTNKKKVLSREKVITTISEALSASLFTRNEEKQTRDGSVTVAEFTANTDRRLDLARRRKRDRNAAMLRLIKYVCCVGLEIPYRASRNQTTRHQRIEIVHPSLHLAVMTLNHMGHVSNQSTAELIRFDAGQWLIHDTLREVMQSENKRLKRIADVRLRRVATYAHYAMPTLLTEHNKRKS